MVARTAMMVAVDWIATNLGWYYVLTMTLVIGFVLWVAFSKEGEVRLGPDHSRPQYKLATWVAMLFAAGVGIDMLFFSVTGPVVQYLHPPSGEGGTPAAMQDAVVWTMFHYGIAGWAVYALLGMAMGYFAYRWGMPLSIRAALYPLLGKRVRGPLGDGISIIALVGTVFGVATSMGIGVVLLSVGFSLLFGLEQGLGAADRAGHRRGGPDHRGHHLGRRPRHPLDLRAEPLERRGDDGLHPHRRTDGVPPERPGREHRPVPGHASPHARCRPLPTSPAAPSGWADGRCSSGRSGSRGHPLSAFSSPAFRAGARCASS